MSDYFAAADGRKRRPHLRLVWRNRRALAESIDWPPGVLVTCEWLDGQVRGWSVMWSGAGYVAHGDCGRVVHRESAAELVAAMKADGREPRGNALLRTMAADPANGLVEIRPGLYYEPKLR